MSDDDRPAYPMTINETANQVRLWREETGFVTEHRNILAKLMLVVTECAEAAEDARHERWDHFGEEIADAIIRLFDIGDSLGYDLEHEIYRKQKINMERPRRNGIPEASDE